MLQRLEWSCRTGSQCSEATQPSKQTRNRGHEEQKVKLLHTAPIMGRFPALRLLAAVPTRSRIPIRTQREMRRHRPAWLTGRMTGLRRGRGNRPAVGTLPGEQICAVFRGSRAAGWDAVDPAELRHEQCCSGVVSVLQPDWLRWEEARSRRCAAHGRSTAARSPQSMRAKRQVGWRRVYLFTW